MDSLSGITWDVVISGTGIRESLLALWVDRCPQVANINLTDSANRTVLYHAQAGEFFTSTGTDIMAVTKQPSVCKMLRPGGLSTNPQSDKLGPSRSYTLTLSPHLIFSQSTLLPAIVSSRLHNQLDFQAIGPWWIYRDHVSRTPEKQAYSQQGTDSKDEPVASIGPERSGLQKIPSNREDVFADDTLSPREKRALMKFLRSILSESNPDPEQSENAPLASTLATQFGIAPALQQPLLALSLSYDPTGALRTGSAAPRIKRHVQSIGAFGPGFGAVMPKYGGAAEIVQVACRASAVGGAVYILGRGLQKVEHLAAATEEPSDKLLHLTLSDGEEINSQFLAGCAEGFPSDVANNLVEDTTPHLTDMAHSISIVSSPLQHLFPPTSENGLMPAGAVVVNSGQKHSSLPDDIARTSLPIYMVVHSAESGECPLGQCVIYASTSSQFGGHDARDFDRLDAAVADLLDASPTPEIKPEVLWCLKYRAKGRGIDVAPGRTRTSMSGRVMAFPPPSVDLAFDDSILDSVREMWKRIMGGEVDEAEFMRFGDGRGGGGEDEEEA